MIGLPPNPSLNTDVPHAGLRPRSGPPVSLVRWAARAVIMSELRCLGSWKCGFDPQRSITPMITQLATALVTSMLMAQPSAEAQQVRVARVGVIASGAPDSSTTLIDAFRQRLRELGYVEGRNIAIEIRYADEVRYATAQSQRYRDVAAELAGRGVDVIVASGTLATRGAKEVTSTIPIVMVSVGGAVNAGLVKSLARPDGNITGQSFLGPELAIKDLDLLTEVVPSAKRIAWVYNPEIFAEPSTSTGPLEAAARRRGVTIERVAIRQPNDLEPMLAAMGQARPNALLTTAVNVAQLNAIVEVSAKHRLPAIYAFREAVDAGGLMSFGPRLPDLWRGAANYVDKILKGAKPGDLPVEQPTTFELVINLKAAKALAITFPASVRARADLVIE